MVGQSASTSQLRTLVAGAYGAALGGSRTRPPVIGTEHLLASLVGPLRTGPAAQVLDEAGLTGTTVMTMLRRRATGSAAWQVEEDSDPGGDDLPLTDLDWFKPGKRIHYTAAARAALHRAVAAATARGHVEPDGLHLLDGLLADGDNHAIEVLHACGVDPAQVRESLRGTGTAAADAVPPELRPTRDALLGRRTYPTGPISGPAFRGLSRVFAINLAGVPAMWVSLDARDQARRQGRRRPGTEHLVLAMLATHETLRHYPHLRSHDARQYVGGEVLDDAGVTYPGAIAASQHPADLGTDAHPASWYTSRPRRIRSRPTGTGELLLAILTQDDSRAANLLRLTGAHPARLRTHLRARLSAR
jgi:ATP-dependent Clp protease ATP-binding subunit ClpA